MGPKRADHGEHPAWLEGSGRCVCVGWVCGKEKEKGMKRSTKLFARKKVKKNTGGWEAGVQWSEREGQ
eukprot:m.39890 g.39890  ORF g.39890 m.39890 type:complete len:68 (+) comp13799_c0_seq1:206-409(+)